MKKFEIPTVELFSLNNRTGILTTSIVVDGSETSTSGARMPGMYYGDEEEEF